MRCAPHSLMLSALAASFAMHPLQVSKMFEIMSKVRKCYAGRFYQFGV